MKQPKERFQRFCGNLYIYADDKPMTWEEVDKVLKRAAKAGLGRSKNRTLKMVCGPAFGTSEKRAN